MTGQALAMMENLHEELFVPAEDFDRFLASLGWTWQQLMRGELPGEFESFEELQLACIQDDPYLWCQYFLKEPTDPAPPEHKAPYNFFPYQIESLRHLGSFVHYDGAEVGKTRELIAKACYLAYTRPGGSMLIGTPETDQLLPILRAILDQLEWNPMLAAELKLHEKQPHHTLYFKNGFEMLFRPAKHDGRTFRGKHVKTAAFMDEGAVLCNPMQWSEFYRAMEPGCILGVYSVPNGKRNEFYRLGQIARGNTKDAAEEPGAETGMPIESLRLFHWPKTIMPAPFWSESREKWFEKLYGGKTSPGYQHNVLGVDGDPESSAFPWPLYSKCLREIPEYRCLKITASNGEAVIIGYRIEEKEQVTLLERTVPLDTLDIRREINGFFHASQYIPLYSMGADLGQQEPTEFEVRSIDGLAMRKVARVRLQGLEYPILREAWDELDSIFDRGKLHTRSGVDAGNAGTAFLQELYQAYPEKQYIDRCIPVMFGSKVEELDHTNEPIIDKSTGKPVTKRVKTVATSLIVRMMMDGNFIDPYDPDLIKDFPGHTYKVGSDGDLVFNGKDDHTIDSTRTNVFVHTRPDGSTYSPEDVLTSGQKLSAFGSDSGFSRGDDDRRKASWE